MANVGDEDLSALEYVEPAQTDVLDTAGGAVQSSSFKDFCLKPELDSAIQACGFEHPSQVQQECIPQAVYKSDIVCQAKSGMGKTAVFVLSTLNNLTPVDGEVHVLVMCHARELADQIFGEYERFAKFFKDPEVKVARFFGGFPVSQDIKTLNTAKPNIVVGTPGRIKDLVQRKALDLSNLKVFILDECDTILDPAMKNAKRDPLKMRRDVQEIFMATPRKKQVMMFTATLSDETRKLCERFMVKPVVITIPDEELKLNSLVQYHVQLPEAEKNRKLLALLDDIQFNQLIIFLNNQRRAETLAALLKQEQFPVEAIHGGMKQPARLAVCERFKKFQTRILCATDVFGRGMDIEKVNVVINFDMPSSPDTYLHRVARAGRFGTKGLAITFLKTDKEAGEEGEETDLDVFNATMKHFSHQIEALPDVIEQSSYMEV